MLEQLIESSEEMERGISFAADDDTAGTVAAATRCFYAGVNQNTYFSITLNFIRICYIIRVFRSGL